MQLRQYTRPFDGTYVFEPFLRQTFGVDSENWVEEFDNYINSFNKDKILKDFMKRTFDKYKQNNFNPIKLDESDTAYLLSIQNIFNES